MIVDCSSSFWLERVDEEDVIVGQYHDFGPQLMIMTCG